MTEVDNSHLDFVQLSNRVDFSEFNYGSVLKEQMNEKQFLVLDTNHEQKMNLYYTKSSVALSDSHWKLFGIFSKSFDIYEQLSEYKYYKKLSPEKPTSEKTYFNVYLRSDDLAHSYSRQTHSLLTYIGITYSVFYLIFGIMQWAISGIIHKLYVGALLEKTYQVQSYEQGGTENKDKERDVRKLELKEIRKRHVDEIPEKC